MEDRFEVADHGVVWRFSARGKNVLELSADAAGGFFRMERSRCGKFGELSALPRKFRLHRSVDGMAAELESESVIPFGCEYLVARTCRVSSGVAELVSDFSAVNCGRVDGVELEPVVFAGEWKSVEMLVFGEEKFRRISAPSTGCLYSGAEPPLMLRVVFASGRRCEFALGCDVWRHRGAMRINGAHSEYELVADSDGIRLSRRVLIYAPETEPERRSWRYSALIGWDNGDAALRPPDGEAFELPGCAMSASVRRELRRIARRAAGSLVWRNVEPGVCFDPAHAGRAGRAELEHFDLAEYLEAWRWANRELTRRGRGFRIVPSEDGLFAGSVIMRRLSEATGELV